MTDKAQDGDVKLETQALELLARLCEAQRNKAAAFTVRRVGAVGTVLEDQLALLKAALASPSHGESPDLTEQQHRAISELADVGPVVPTTAPGDAGERVFAALEACIETTPTDRVKLPSGAYLEGEGATAYIALFRAAQRALSRAVAMFPTTAPEAAGRDELIERIDALYHEAAEGPWEAVEADSLKYTSVVQFRYQSGEVGTVALIGQSDATVGDSDLDRQNATTAWITDVHNAWPQIRAALSLPDREAIRREGVAEGIEKALYVATHHYVGKSQGACAYVANDIANAIRALSDQPSCGGGEAKRG